VWEQTHNQIRFRKGQLRGRTGSSAQAAQRASQGAGRFCVLTSSLSDCTQSNDFQLNPCFNCDLTDRLRIPQLRVRGNKGALPYVTGLGRNWPGIEIHRYFLALRTQRIQGALQTGPVRELSASLLAALGLATESRAAFPSEIEDKGVQVRRRRKGRALLLPSFRPISQDVQLRAR